MLFIVLVDDPRTADFISLLSSAVQSNDKGFMVVSFCELRKIMHEYVVCPSEQSEWT